jgi:protein-disulfide isomerase
VSNPLLQKQSRKGMITGIVVVGVIVVALAVGVTVQYVRTNSDVEASTGGTEPAMITGPGTSGQGVTVGNTGAPHKLELYVDYRCPHCKEFEDSAGSTINQLVDDGTATLTYLPLAFVDEQVSPRAANGFACAAEAGKARSYNDALFDNFGKAWTPDQLIDLGTQLGISDPSFGECVRSGKYQDWVASVGTAGEQRGVTSTPSMYVDGKALELDQMTPEGIKAAVGEQ